jgi:glycogen phosphorylase
MVPDQIPQSATSLEDLQLVGRNLRWTWHAEVAELFRRLDPQLWESTECNPLRLLASLPADRLEALLAEPAFAAEAREAAAELRRHLASRDTWFNREGGDPTMRIAYFSAEFALARCLPIYAGGLGVLAADHLKSASDMGLPVIGVGLLYREGYLRQSIDAQGAQHEAYPALDPEQAPLMLERAADGSAMLVDVPIADRVCHAQIWRADVGRVPLYLLDTDVASNAAEERRITDRLYGGDPEHRLLQEIVLGIGGLRALHALGIRPTVIHLNEGHAAFAAVERVREALTDDEPGSFRHVAQRLAPGVVFTTHTPVAAGHDRFPPDMLKHWLGAYAWETHEAWDQFLTLGRLDVSDGEKPFGMTTLALRLSGHRNGVSRIHGEVSRRMWAPLWPDTPVDRVPIGHITNGVHLPTWVGPRMRRLYTGYIGAGWDQETDDLRWQRALHMPASELWAARNLQRAQLVAGARRVLARDAVARGEDPAWAATALDAGALTIVFARRFAAYKRATLLLSNVDRFLRLLHGDAPVQFIFAGKAHPQDDRGKELVRAIAELARNEEHRGRLVFLQDYDIGLAHALVQGADVWLNVPRHPYEASGTSGMKAAANGALNLSVLDGWWAEAWEEHNRQPEPIGWAIHSAGTADTEAQDRADAQDVYRLLEAAVVPLFQVRDGDDIPVEWLTRVRASIRQIVPFFNTHRMVAEYYRQAYAPAHTASAEREEAARDHASPKGRAQG